jgi:glyoxylase-like metal-dependent hydrolase (beta-lactamase superfamily II)
MGRIHHLNCTSLCPIGGKLVDGYTPSIFQRGELVCHCLLIENDRELILIDTGLGLEDVRNPKSRLSSLFLGLVRPEFREEMTAYRQIERIGFHPHDVRNILLTHLDFDHAGGIDDFPHATVHVSRAERDSAFSQRTWLDQQRYRPEQWKTRKNWKFYDEGIGESWFGFNGVRSLPGVPEEILSVPLIGHTRGHVGFAIPQGDGWKLNAGDAYFHHREIDPDDPYCTPGLRFYQFIMAKDRRTRLLNLNRLRNLKKTHGTEVDIFCSHDVTEFEALAGRSATYPPEFCTDRCSPGLRHSSPVISEKDGELYIPS